MGWRDYPYPLGHEVRPQVPARCKFCTHPADARDGLCQAHHDRTRDERMDASWEVDDQCF